MSRCSTAAGMCVFAFAPVSSAACELDVGGVEVVVSGLSLAGCVIAGYDGDEDAADMNDVVKEGTLNAESVEGVEGMEGIEGVDVA